jgi:MarR-like DNA-binding transcriptional regulator SgrR of sgrS sRNA
MCDPATAMLVLTAATTAMTVDQQQQQASAQEAANQRQYENSMKAMAANVNQTNAAHMQQREAAMQKLDENNMQARAAKSTAQVSAGENGISGLSVDALLADLGNRQQRFNSSVTTNYENTEQAINNQRENIGIDAASQINSLKTPAMPDYAGAALRIGTAAYDYYNPRVSDRRVRG